MLFRPQKHKTGPVIIDEESSSSSATKKKAIGKEYKKRKQTNGFTINNLHKHVGSLSKNPPKDMHHHIKIPVTACPHCVKYARIQILSDSYDPV